MVRLSIARQSVRIQAARVLDGIPVTAPWTLTSIMKAEPEVQGRVLQVLSQQVSYETMVIVFAC